MTLERMTYTEGYVSGQHDVLTWLSTSPNADGHVMAAFDERVQFRAALICLASNLAIAGAMERMYQLGALTGYWSCSCDEPQDPDWINPTWHPNAKGWAATDKVDHWNGNPIDVPNTAGKAAP